MDLGQKQRHTVHTGGVRMGRVCGWGVSDMRQLTGDTWHMLRSTNVKRFTLSPLRDFLSYDWFNIYSNVKWKIENRWILPNVQHHTVFCPLLYITAPYNLFLLACLPTDHWGVPGAVPGFWPHNGHLHEVSAFLAFPPSNIMSEIETSGERQQERDEPGDQEDLPDPRHYDQVCTDQI